MQLEGDGLAVSGNGCRELLLGVQGKSEVVVGAREFRFTGNGVLKGGDGLGQLLLFIKAVAEAEIGRRVFRIEFDRLGVGGNSLGQFLLVTKSVAEVVMGPGAILFGTSVADYGQRKNLKIFPKKDLRPP